MSGRLLLRAPEVAALLGMSVRAFHAARARLRDRGFPAPVPGMGPRYDPRAIEAWLARAQGKAAASPPVEDIAGWQAELDRRAMRGRP